ncbi:MAG: hydroxymethylglutaryl-CoA lyase [Bacteroidota bacterium]
MKKESIHITEIGLRDGMQSLPFTLPTNLKIELIEGLIDAGVKEFEAASFVHPDIVPNMADAETLLNALIEHTDTRFTALVLNRKGIERAMKTNVDGINFLLYASDTFAHKNSNKSAEAQIDEVKALVPLAKSLKKVTVSIGVSFGCRYEGKISIAKVEELIQLCSELQIDKLNIADTTGMGYPDQVGKMVEVAQRYFHPTQISFHFHNTENRGYANVYAALQAGIRHFETSFGGLGGCPFIPNASGNVATEDVVHMLEGMGYQTGINLEKVMETSKKFADNTGWELDSKIYQLKN